jgi:hypothetical protein
MAVDTVVILARHLHTPIGEIEDLDWDRFIAYQEALGRVLSAENPKK